MVYNNSIFINSFSTFKDEVIDVLRPLQDEIKDLESEMQKKGVYFIKSHNTLLKWILIMGLTKTICRELVYYPVETRVFD